MKYLFVLIFSQLIYGQDELESMREGDSKEKLYSDLFATYSKDNYPDNVTITFGLVLRGVQFDTSHHIMITNVWLRMIWTDDRFVWDNPNPKSLRVPSDLVWTPDISLYNGVSVAMDCCPRSRNNVIIFPNGEVDWLLSCRLESFCHLTLDTNGPYEEQECALHFGSLTYNSETMGLELYDNITTIDTYHFHSQKYKVVKNAAVCEERFHNWSEDKYASVKVTLGFKRIEKVCEKD